MPTTDWAPEATDARSGTYYTWPWVVGMDDEVAIDVTAQLAPLETPTNVTRTLWKLRIPGETDHTDVTATNCVGGATVVGNVVKQRLSNLVRGRVYRLYILHGAAGNTRAASVVIEVNP